MAEKAEPYLGSKTSKLLLAVGEREWFEVSSPKEAAFFARHGRTMRGMGEQGNKKKKRDMKIKLSQSDWQTIGIKMGWFITSPRMKPETSDSDLKVKLEGLRGALAAKAQERYDNWDQDDDGHDEVMGHGGICHEIADLFGEVLSANGIEWTTINFDDVNHVACVAYDDNEGWIVDMPCGIYERGAWYTWKKIKDVVFEGSDVTMSSISREDVQGLLDYGG